MARRETLGPPAQDEPPAPELPPSPAMGRAATPDRRGHGPKGTGGMPRRHQDSGRGRLRYVRGSGPTRIDPGMPAERPGELKHLSTRRKRKQPRLPQ